MSPGAVAQDAGIEREEGPIEISPPGAIGLSPIAEGAATNTEGETPTVQEIVLPSAPVPDGNFLKINYSFDGQLWYEIKRVDPRNWPRLTVPLPVKDWAELRRIQISVEGIPTALPKVPDAYLDGMFLQAHYEVNPVIGGAALEGGGEPAPSSSTGGGGDGLIVPLADDLRPIPVPQKSDFGTKEAPSFELNLRDIPTLEMTPELPVVDPPPPESEPESSSSSPVAAILRSLAAIFGIRGNLAQAEEGGGLSRANPAVAWVSSPGGEAKGIKPSILIANDVLRVTIPPPGREFRPGKYRLHLLVLRDGVTYETYNDFTWGVFAVNFNKSIYTLGDEASAGFAVLDDGGHTICDADIFFKLTAPSGGVEYFSTAEGRGISRNDTCGPITVTTEPDYSSKFRAGEVGRYRIEAVAETKNGPRAMEDYFEVQTSPLFDVERHAPTRIYPVAGYEVAIRIRANQDFRGVIRETVPSSFSIGLSGGTRTIVGGTAVLSWQVDLVSGAETELRYTMDAPDVSPELFRIGPLEIGSWREIREWQIASDAVGDVIILWDGGSIPTGWTCISCAAGDPFTNVFPRASSSYAAATSSVNTLTHTLTFSSAVVNGSVGMNGNAAGTAFPTDTHTHTWGNPTLTSSSIEPPYENLKFIRANTSTLPAGAIGIFDTSSSSLPANWSYYSALAGDYLRASSATSSGGSATHTHTTTANLTSGTSAGSYADPGNGLTTATGAHDHTIASGTSVDVDNNDPSFVEVVFAKLSTQGGIPAGMIAIFDATPPTGWTQISSAGPYAGNLLKGASSFGTTGGRTTHSHGSPVVLTSGGPSATSNNRSGTAAQTASSAHVHDVTYTASSETILPVYRDVILAKKDSTGPTVSQVSVNGGAAITLIGNTTNPISVNYTIQDLDGCADVFTSGGVTTTLYRSGVGSACSANNQNCYISSLVTSNNCTSGTSANGTTTFSIYYFADPTDASSTYSSENWLASVAARDSTANTNSATSSAVELNTLVSIHSTAAEINYGTVPAGANSGSVNQEAPIVNTGNASTTLLVSGTALSSPEIGVLATSSQHFATSSFIFGGTEAILSGVSQAISGFVLRPVTLKQWTLSTALPATRDVFPLVSSRGYLYTLGGSTSTVLKAQIGGAGSVGSWTGTTALPASFLLSGGASHNNFIYRIGGESGGATTSSVNYASTSADGSVIAWTSTAALPSARARAGVAVYGDYLYCVGGAPTTSPGATTTVFFTSFNSNGTLNSWSSTTPLPGSLGFANTSAAAHNGYLYLVGGYVPSPENTGTSTVLFAPINATGSIGTWNTTTPMPFRPQHHSLAILDGTMYVMGGSISPSLGPTSTSFAATILPDGRLGSWTSISAMPAAGYSAGTKVENGKIYLAGGYNISNAQTTTVKYYGPTQSTGNTYWGIQVAGGAGGGTYTGTLTFTAQYSP